MCMCLCVFNKHVWKSEDNLKGAGFSLSTVWVLGLNLDLRLDSRHLYPLSHHPSRTHTQPCDLEAGLSFSLGLK